MGGSRGSWDVKSVLVSGRRHEVLAVKVPVGDEKLGTVRKGTGGSCFHWRFCII